MTNVMPPVMIPVMNPAKSRSALKQNSLKMLLLIAVGMLLGCVYRIDIQQGNFLEPKDVDRVAVGMTRVQVRALLGTPMVADPFENGRWDYVYYLKKGRWHKAEQRHFIVFFDALEKVNRIDRSDKASITVDTPPANPA
jgi:outer membrane protein assembly factor BamE